MDLNFPRKLTKVETQLQSKYAKLKGMRKRHFYEVVMQGEDPLHYQEQKLSYAQFAMEGAKELIKTRAKELIIKKFLNAKDKKVSS